MTLEDVPVSALVVGFRLRASGHSPRARAYAYNACTECRRYDPAAHTATVERAYTECERLAYPVYCALCGAEVLP